MTLDDLLKLAKAPRRIEAVQAGSATVYVRGLSAADVERAVDRAGTTKRSMDACLLTEALCDEGGTPLVGNPDDHLAALEGIPATLARRLAEAINRASDVPAGGVAHVAGESAQLTGDGSTASPES